MRALLMISLLLINMSVFAQDDSWFFGKKDGWWFYDEDQIIEDEPPQDPPPPPPPTTSQAPTEEVPSFSVEWLRTQMPIYLDRAIDNPTVENVAAYKYLLRVSMDKSQKFAETYQLATYLDPRLDENSRRPMSAQFTYNFNRTRTLAETELLKTIGTRAGIIFFFQSTCNLCEMQAPNVSTLHNLYGFTIKPVSIDGLPMPSGYFPDFETDQGQAVKLGVVGTPTLFLVSKSIGFKMIGQGVFDISELRARITKIALHTGIITPEEYAPSDPIPNRDYLEPDPSLLTTSTDHSSAQLLQVLQTQPL